MKKEPIEEDKDINTDDVIDDFTPKKGLTESEKRELMSNDGCVPDPDFSRALTFEELNNVADVLISGTDDRKKIRNVHIPADTRSAFPVISVQSPVSIQYCWQS